MTIKQSTGVSAKFGYYPKPIEIENELFSVTTLPDLENSVTFVTNHPNRHKDWIYDGIQLSVNFISGETTSLPYRPRIFSLPKTHVITLHKSENIEDVEFMVWCLSFFTGMRLTITEAGFLDATPVKKGLLVDFVLSQCTIEDAIELALDYLEAERDCFRATKRISAAIHALFIAQYPHNLPFEQFQYLYMALDSCYQLVKAKANPELKRDIPHKIRIEWMCNEFQIKVPDWALAIDKGSEISNLRNDAMHEALFFNEPLGFAIYSNNQPDGKQINVILEMQHLICRLLVAILGKPEAEYVKTRVDSRLTQGLILRA